MRNELSQEYPAIFYGHDNIFTEWHIWTSDGYRRHNYKSYNCDTDSCAEWHYSWFYMNWGWDGKIYEWADDNVSWNKNGWYASGVFQPTGSNTNYNNNLRMITGIR
nr:C10 family peptidase [Cecembia rubra]